MDGAGPRRRARRLGADGLPVRGRAPGHGGPGRGRGGGGVPPAAGVRVATSYIRRRGARRPRDRRQDGVPLRGPGAGGGGAPGAAQGGGGAPAGGPGDGAADGAVRPGGRRGGRAPDRAAPGGAVVAGGAAEGRGAAPPRPPRVRRRLGRVVGAGGPPGGSVLLGPGVVGGGVVRGPRRLAQLPRGSGPVAHGLDRAVPRGPHGGHVPGRDVASRAGEGESIDRSTTDLRKLALTEAGRCRGGRRPRRRSPSGGRSPRPPRTPGPR